jgi:Transcriptional regulators
VTHFEDELNQLFNRIFRSIQDLEEAMLHASKNLNLSISEIHTLEAVDVAGRDSVGATISGISEYLDISLPSVTLAINKLEKKGYVTRQKCENDGRVVRVGLTRQGQRANRAHQYFHRNMVHAISAELEEEDKTALLKGVRKLDAFLDANIAKYEDMQ